MQLDDQEKKHKWILDRHSGKVRTYTKILIGYQLHESEEREERYTVIQINCGINGNQKEREKKGIKYELLTFIWLIQNLKHSNLIYIFLLPIPRSHSAIPCDVN